MQLTTKLSKHAYIETEKTGVIEMLNISCLIVLSPLYVRVHSAQLPRGYGRFLARTSNFPANVETLVLLCNVCVST